MSLPVFVGVLTLTPAVCALLIVAAALVKRALAPLALGLAVIGALVPAIFLLILAPSLSAGVPLFLTLLGGTVGQNDWFSPAYRVDSFGLYAALGIAFIITPLLLWMAWQRGGALLAAETAGDAAAEAEAAPTEDDPSVVTAGAPPTVSTPPAVPLMQRMLARPIWLGLALALGLEAAALTLVFADDILWLALAWLALAALAWGLGEAGSDLETIDRPGLALMLAGPLLWTVVLLLPAIKTTGVRVIYPRLTEMMGRGGIPPLQIVVLGVALALAGGAYPFITWVRRRAALVAPAGLAAVALVVLPVAVFVGARTYSAAQDAANSWQQIGQARPPITGGIALALLGALTVGIAGLLALDRRDGRALVAYLAAAQVGWGLLALGVGGPVAMVGIVLLLTTAVLGLGAMLAALYAGGALTGDIEPDAAGPRPLGAPLRRLHLAAWTVGALAVVGAPLCAGFLARQAISAGALQARGLLVPLTGLAWAGDALLALALLRATAPAFAYAAGAATFSETTAAAGDAVTEPEEAGASAGAVADETDEAEEMQETQEQEVESEAERKVAARPMPNIPELLHEAAAPILALLVVIVSVAPQALLAPGGARLAAGALLQPGAADGVAPATALGYTVGAGQVLVSVAWLAILVLVLLRVFIVPVGGREARPLYLAGQKPAARPSGASGESGETEEPAELSALPAPRDAWQEVAPAFTSPWLLPAGEWLLRGTDDEEEISAESAEEGPDAEDMGAEEEPEEAADLEAAELEHQDEAREAAAVDVEAFENAAGAEAEERPLVVAPAADDVAAAPTLQEPPAEEAATVAAPTQEAPAEAATTAQGVEPAEDGEPVEAEATPAAAVETPHDEAKAEVPASGASAEPATAPVEGTAPAESAPAESAAGPVEEPLETEPMEPVVGRETANGSKPGEQSRRPAPVTATPKRSRKSGGGGKSGRKGRRA